MRELVASLSSSIEEFTERAPYRGGHNWKYHGPLQDGVADRLTVWCAGCGRFVADQVLTGLVVIENGVATVVPLPMVPFNQDPEWGEA